MERPEIKARLFSQTLDLSAEFSRIWYGDCARAYARVKACSNKLSQNSGVKIKVTIGLRAATLQSASRRLPPKSHSPSKRA
jgi:hypothetical protein